MGPRYKITILTIDSFVVNSHFCEPPFITPIVKSFDNMKWAQMLSFTRTARTLEIIL